MSESSFLSRWSRRKAAVREGREVSPEPAAPPAAQPVARDDRAPLHGGQPGEAGQAVPAVPQPPAEPLPTLADAALLKPGDSVARFVARGVDESVKRAALKTLFADPHFNVMDGLDIYIDDYGRPDPIPLDVLRRLKQSETLGLFEPTDEEKEAALAAARDNGAGNLAPDGAGETVVAESAEPAGPVAVADADDGSAAPLAAEPVTEPAIESATELATEPEPAGGGQIDTATPVLPGKRA